MMKEITHQAALELAAEVSLYPNDLAGGFSGYLGRVLPVLMSGMGCRTGCVVSRVEQELRLVWPADWPSPSVKQTLAESLLAFEKKARDHRGLILPPVGHSAPWVVELVPSHFLILLFPTPLSGNEGSRLGPFAAILTHSLLVLRSLGEKPHRNFTPDGTLDPWTVPEGLPYLHHRATSLQAELDSFRDEWERAAAMLPPSRPAPILEQRLTRLSADARDLVLLVEATQSDDRLWAGIDLRNLVRELADGTREATDDPAGRVFVTVDPRVGSFHQGRLSLLTLVLRKMIRLAQDARPIHPIALSVDLVGTSPQADLLRFVVKPGLAGSSAGVGDPPNGSNPGTHMPLEGDRVERDHALLEQLAVRMMGKWTPEGLAGAGMFHGSSFELALDHGPKSHLPPDAEMKGVRVLVAEDNTFNQVVVRSMLQKWGAVVDMAENGLEALEKATQAPFDLILMDIQMPVMDGWASAAAIRSRLGTSVPILALTAYESSQGLHEFQRAGMQGYLVKPLREEELLSEIRRVLQAGPEATLWADLSGLTRLFGHDPALMRNMVRTFLDVTPGYVERLLKASAARDLVAIGDQSHKIKSSLGYVAIPPLRELIARINDTARGSGATKGHTPQNPEIFAWIDEFGLAFRQLCEQLEKEFPA